MKAVFLEKPESIEVKDLPKPELKASGALIRVLKTHVLSFANALVAGHLPAPFPFVPGPSCVGIIEEVGSEVTGLAKGDMVITVPTLGTAPNCILQGWIGFGTPICQKLTEIWRNGTWAEYVVVPATNCIVVTPDDDKTPSIEVLSLVNYLSISYGAIEAGGLQAGQKVLIAGATGGLGRAAVALALAKGASVVYAMARNVTALEKLCVLDPVRIIPIVINDELHNVLARLGGVDLYVDALSPAAPTSITQEGLKAVGPQGTSVFFGGIQGDVSVNYGGLLFLGQTIKGSFMYDISAPKTILAMIRAGSLNTSWLTPESYSLDDIKNAIDKASTGELVVLSVGEVEE